MTQDEFNELKAQIEVVAANDVRLGQVLASLLTHLGALAQVQTTPVVEPAPAQEGA